MRRCFIQTCGAKKIMLITLSYFYLLIDLLLAYFSKSGLKQESEIHIQLFLRCCHSSIFINLKSSGICIWLMHKLEDFAQTVETYISERGNIRLNTIC